MATATVSAVGSGVAAGLTRGTWRPLKVMVVDDDPETLARLKDRLLGGGHSVVTAPHGELALARYQPDIDVIICDILMPEMDGLQLICQLRRQCPDVRIIACSEGSRVLSLGAALRMAAALGAVRVCTKDEIFAKLLDEVAAVAPPRPAFC